MTSRAKQREYNRKYRLAHRDEINERQRIWSKRHPVQKSGYWRKSYIKHLAQRRRYHTKYMREWMKKNPKLAKIYAQVQQLKEKKPCIICGTTRNIHRHHPDYTRPKHFIYLCRKHHQLLHRFIKLLKLK